MTRELKPLGEKETPLERLVRLIEENGPRSLVLLERTEARLAEIERLLHRSQH